MVVLLGGGSGCSYARKTAAFVADVASRQATWLWKGLFVVGSLRANAQAWLPGDGCVVTIMRI